MGQRAIQAAGVDGANGLVASGVLVAALEQHLRPLFKVSNFRESALGWPGPQGRLRAQRAWGGWLVGD
jgi:hypothetical protein